MTELFNGLIDRLKAKETNQMTASDLERFINEQFEIIVREAVQAKLDLIGVPEAETVVTGSDGVARPRKKSRVKQ